jgi:hypothetical protein
MSKNRPRYYKNIKKVHLAYMANYGVMHSTVFLEKGTGADLQLPENSG